MSDPLKPEIFKQRVPCADCPFRREGGVRHGREMMASYASYFLTDPGATFPCHKSVPKDDTRETWSAWRDGQVVCAGGLLLAAKYQFRNALVRFAVAKGMYDPSQHTADELALVFDTFEEMVGHD